MQILAVLFSVAIGGIAYVFLYPTLSGERNVARRMQNVASTEPQARAARGQKSRRDAIETTLKDFEERQKKPKGCRCRFAFNAPGYLGLSDNSY